MSTPSQTADGAAQHASAASPAESDGDNMTDIPRRLMRVKILYTFDDQNKSNCLARLPNALSIPTVSLDETTQIGVIELRTCIQAIVSASPELVAKLGHDYTVYAFDYSEYETPLVGQGMLSWILASASTTPNAPAEQSQTMVTGRVCKNILGLFSNGIKETLEVKLKLVQVPTCMQSEYVENMERYHNLSKVMPEGMDYSAWAEFLKANPAIRHLAQPSPEHPYQPDPRSQIGGVESFHQMLTRPSPSDGGVRNDSFYDQHRPSFSAYDTRASSPAMSSASFFQYPAYQDSRPASRASLHSEAAAPAQRYPPTISMNQEQQEEGPPKKRARTTKAKRPKKTALTTNKEPLRVTASTAASVRLHRPVATNPGAAISVEQVPRAPTPRPEDARMPQLRGPLRPPAPSLLRHASMDESRPYISPYDTNIFSDNAIDSADDERAGSAGETPLNIPSSPPVVPQQITESAPSSPELPLMSLVNDSGFVSDMPTGRDEAETDARDRAWDGSDFSAPEVRVRAKPDRSHRAWTEVNPGPVELLPKSYVPKPNTYNRSRPTQAPIESQEQQSENTLLVESNVSIDEQLLKSFQNKAESEQSTTNNPTASGYGGQANAPMAARSPTESVPFDQAPHDWPIDPALESDRNMESRTGISVNTNESEESTRSSTLNRQPKPSAASKPRGLPRSHTWSAGEPMSDAAVPAESNGCQPRSGSGAKRRQNIKEKLEKALVAGEMPTYCNNCGQIETPTWRKAFTRIENGSPTGITLSSKGTGIAAFEVLEPAEGGDSQPQYRIFKQALEQEEKESQLFTTITLCNPCGLWLTKKNSMRPHEIWAKSRAANDGDKPKRKRKPKKPKNENEEFMSDAIVPYSEPATMDLQGEPEVPASMDGGADSEMQPPLRRRSSSFQTTTGSQLDEAAAQAALIRAIQSSPVGLRGSKDSPIDIEADLTPRPTRRLLFPSPRKDGEVKSLEDSPSPQSPSGRTSASKAESAVRLPTVDVEDTNKENCPPPPDADDDDLTHLFESPKSPKTTPTKSRTLEDLLKTPTPGSRRRVPLTPKRNAENAGLTTPSRITKTPRTAGRAATIGPETPFTRQLNALLSDIPTSPSHGIDFSAFPTFNTPGRNSTSGAPFPDFLADDFLSSDLPMPSSPPEGLGFSVFEDPNTSTVGLWSGASIFEGSDAVIPDAGAGGNEEHSGGADPTMLKMNGISMDFAVLIEEVVGSSGKSPEAKRGSSELGQGQTPEVQGGRE